MWLNIFSRFHFNAVDILQYLVFILERVTTDSILVSDIEITAFGFQNKNIADKRIWKLKKVCVRVGH